MIRLSSRHRLTKAAPGPWGPSDGPVAGGTPPTSAPLTDEPMSASGFSFVRVGPESATVDSAFPDLDDMPTIGGGGMGRTEAAGRLNRGMPS
jgi:hypothetical protein